MASFKGAIDRIKKSVSDFVERIRNFDVNKKVQEFTARVSENVKALVQGKIGTKEIGASI